MIHWGENGLEAFTQLQIELDWLKHNHQNKIHLINLAESHIKSIRQAASTNGVIINSKDNDISKLEFQERVL